LNEVDEVLVVSSGDDLMSSIPVDGRSINWDLEVLDEVFENLSFL
jgi:hypothetical protein